MVTYRVTEKLPENKGFYPVVIRDETRGLFFTRPLDYAAPTYPKHNSINGNSDELTWCLEMYGAFIPIQDVYPNWDVVAWMDYDSEKIK